MLASAVWLAGSPLCQRQAPLPAEVAGVWDALRLPALAAAERMADAGRRLAGALLDDAGQQLLAGAAGPAAARRHRRGGAGAAGAGAVAAGGADPAGHARRAWRWARWGCCRGSACPAGSPPPRPGSPGSRPRAPPPAAGLAGPLKVLAAVAAPDETKTRNAPLDAEAEMQAVLDAVTDVAGQPDAQVRILEVASLAAIRQALAAGRLPCAAPVRARVAGRRWSWRTRTAPRSQVTPAVADGGAAARRPAGAADRAVVVLGRGGRLRRRWPPG